MAAIAARHVGIDGSILGSHPLVLRFMKGVLRHRPLSKPMAPTWDLALFLDALCEPPFDPLGVCGPFLQDYPAHGLGAISTPFLFGVRTWRLQSVRFTHVYG